MSDHEGNMIQQLQTALQVRCPVTAVSVPGRAPWRGRTDVVRRSLKGLRILHIEAMPAERENGTVLRVEAVGKGVKATRVLYSLSLYQAKRMVDDWSRGERKRRAKAAMQPMPPKVPRGKQAHAKMLDKLAKELRNTNVKPPVNAMLKEMEYGRTRQQSRLESDARQRAAIEKMRAEGSSMPDYQTIGEQWARWKREAGMRHKLCQLARQVSHGTKNTAWLYREAEMLTGHAVRKYSDVTGRERERQHLEHIGDYLKRFWEFCHLAEKPWGFKPQEWHEMDFGPQHYAAWLEGVREAKGLRSQIENVKMLMEDGNGNDQAS